jgi:hypothetical protein
LFGLVGIAAASAPTAAIFTAALSPRSTRFGLVDGPLVVERAEVFNVTEFFAAATADLRGVLRLAMTSVPFR